MTEVLNWLLIALHIQFKILLLVSKSQLVLAPNVQTSLQHLPPCTLLSVDMSFSLVLVLPFLNTGPLLWHLPFCLEWSTPLWT